ncbi:MAG: Rv1355c family protein [Flavobacteriales bacterium]|nr:Rv1355c family protein [Flavobacteriales bacterium]
MDNLLEALLHASAPDRDSYRPLFFRPSDPNDRAGLEDLLKSKPQLVVHDVLENQLAELVRCTHPDRRFTSDALKAAVNEHLKGQALHDYGVWVYYPWSSTLVHLLDEIEFVRVRTDRNRNKITAEEQSTLSTKKVGVIGLSVGQSVSLTLALERTFGEIRLADYDTLELNNLNRIRSGVHEMSNLKVVNAAREIVELDPFLKVTIFPEGLTQANMDHFFTEGGTLDLLVEECDSVDIKILARQKARALRIPVVMDMSDRGCMDIERFDLEPDRPLMHGWIDHLDLEAAGRPMTNEEKIPYMLPIVGTETLSTRMKASMIEMGETISTWPQLASAVTLGGAMTADVHRRIMLGQFTASGRWYVDLEERIGPSHDLSKTKLSSTDNATAAQKSHQPLPTISGLPQRSLSADEARELAGAAALAPSAGNCQPWHFVFQNGRLLILHDRTRSASRWDPDDLMAHIALGGALENIVVKAAELKLPIRIEISQHAGTGPHIATVEAVMGAEEEQDVELAALAPWIRSRCTNRKIEVPSVLPGSLIQGWRQSLERYTGCSLLVIDDRNTIDELAELCSRSEMVRLLDPEGHREFFEKEVRWTPEDAARTGDGLDLETMEMTPSQRAALRIAADADAISLVHSWRGGRALQRFSRKGIQNASAIAVVMVPDLSLGYRLTGGRAVQRFWMEANRSNWSIHPISAALFLTHAQKSIPDLDPHLRAELGSVAARLRPLFIGSGEPLFMMRLSQAGEPTARSLRLSLKDLFTVVPNED